MSATLDDRFDRPLFIRALTHDSFAHENDCEHNERLEFLGDAVLQFLVSERLFAAHPDASEADLHRMRMAVVANHHLAKVSEARGVAARVRVGRSLLGLERSDNPDIFAAAYEAVLGAIFLEDGIDGARVEITAALGGDLASGRIERDPLNVLQEWHQRRHGTTPDYQLIERLGPDHRARHKVRLELPTEGLVFVGEASRLKHARRHAAEQAVASLLASGELESA